MPDIISLLPDAVANQIAAGEVVQRPASVIKELVENAIDAGSSKISIILKDSGKTLIQVIDNGKGMSPQDAAMAFERHATSKIKTADDLFAITTMGFRGEALASIAAVADVTLKTRREEDDLGTEVKIKGTEVTGREPVSCPVGSNFMIRSLFFNVPARRKFLKKDRTEFNHIVTEFQRIALVYPHIAFELHHNDTKVYHLKSGTLKERIVSVFGRGMNQNIANISNETSIVKIYGFIGKPEIARKKPGEQYFFINNRFMKNPFFNKAVMNAYQQILPPESYPTYFIYLEADPSTIDVNIHPTKTEIKFENDQAIFHILTSAVREGLGKFNIIPSIDFETAGVVNIPTITSSTEFRQPEIKVDHSFNPFERNERSSGTSVKSSKISLEKENNLNWQKLYSDFENENTQPQTETYISPEPEQQQLLQQDDQVVASKFFQVKKSYIATPVKSGLMIIDQRKAHIRILFEQYKQSLQGSGGVSQQSLFPATIELNSEDYHLIKDELENLLKMGLDVRDFGKNSVVVQGMPAELMNADPKETVENILVGIKATDMTAISAHEKIALATARMAAINHGTELSVMEMEDIFNRLFACELPNYTPSGKPTLFIWGYDEIEKKLS